MTEACSLAAEKSRMSASKGKNFQDRKAHYSHLEPGDRVLVRKLSERGGPGKLRAYWEDQIHVVVERKGDSPVYEVEPEGGGRKHRVLHRNLLLPCDFLPLTQEQKHQTSNKAQRVSRISKQTRSASRTATDCDSDDDELFHDDELIYQCKFGERSTHGDSTNSEPVAAPDQPVLL